MDAAEETGETGVTLSTTGGRREDVTAPQKYSKSKTQTIGTTCRLQEKPVFTCVGVEGSGAHERLRGDLPILRIEVSGIACNDRREV